METWAFVALAGLVAGAITFAVMPGKARGGIIVTMLVGCIAAVGMTWVGRQVGLIWPGHTIGFFTAVIGTGLILAVWSIIMSRA